MRKYALTAALAVCGVAGTAQAAPTTNPITPVYTQGNFGITNSSATVFENFNSTTPPTGGQQYVGNTKIPGVTETVSPANAGNPTVLLLKSGDSEPNVATDPGTGDNYIAIEPGGSFQVSFANAMRYFSFAVGTLGYSDTVTINFADGSNQVLNGFQIGGSSSSSSPTSLYQTNGRVTFNAGYGPAFSSIIFSVANASSGGSPAFEFTDLAAAAPEPATWGLMILGFGFVGGALRLRRRNSTSAFA